MKNVLLAPVSPPVDLARGRETQIGPILAHFGHFGTFGLSGALLLDPENQRNGESYLLIWQPAICSCSSEYSRGRTIQPPLKTKLIVFPPISAPWPFPWPSWVWLHAAWKMSATDAIFTPIGGRGLGRNFSLELNIFQNR